MQSGKHIWIIGASSGIGAELAKRLASQGAVLALSARNEEQLLAVKNSCSGKGHLAFPLDVTESTEVVNAAKSISKSFGKIDSIIFMAGVYTPAKIADMDINAARHIIDVNLNGALNVTYAVLPIMLKQRTGQIAICASVAGYRGLPNAQPYGASKAGLINFAESLKIELEGNNIDVKLICPGFVKTRLTDKNKFKMPGIISAEMAAEEIARGLQTSKFEIHFPRKFTYGAKLLRILPNWAYFKIASKLK